MVGTAEAPLNRNGYFDGRANRGSQAQAQARTLTMKRRKDGLVARVLDVTGWSDERIDRTICGMLINTDVSEWGVYDSAWDAPPHRSNGG